MKKINLALFVAAAVTVIFTFNSCTEEEATPITTGGGGDTTTFEADVKPIITSSCAPCHVAGGAGTNYSTYNNSANAITTILDRVNRDESAAGFMPNGGTKLSDADIATLTKWQSDGLVEK